MKTVIIDFAANVFPQCRYGRTYRVLLMQKMLIEMVSMSRK